MLADCISQGNPDPLTVWDIIKNNKEGSYAKAILYVISLLKVQFPFLHEFIDENEHYEADKLILRECIQLLSDLPSDQEFLLPLYEDFMAKEFSVFSKSTSGDFYTPKGIVQCMGALLDIKQGTLYDPCCGSGAMLIGAAGMFSKDSGLTLYGQVQDLETYKICAMNLLLHGLDVNLGERPANTLTSDAYNGQKFDYIISNPPFNSPWLEGCVDYKDDRWRYGIPPRQNGNFAWLQHILSHLSENGRAAVILPNQTLTSRQKDERHIRESLVRDGVVEAIITFPRGLFYNTKIPFCVWLLNRPRKRSNLLMIDAERLHTKIEKTLVAENSKQIEDFVNKYRQGVLQKKSEAYAVVSLEELSEKDYILSPNWYTSPHQINLSEIKANRVRFNECIEELHDVLVDEKILSHIEQWEGREASEVWTKVALTDLYEVFGGLSKSKEEIGQGCPALDTKTIIRHPFIPDALSLRMQVLDEERTKYNIKCGDILLNRTSETVSELACCCIATKDMDAVYTGFVKRLRPISEHSLYPSYAAGYFRSAVYRCEIANVSTVFTTRINIDNYKLSKVSIYYPDWNMQCKVGDTLLALFRYMQDNPNKSHTLLMEFERLLIEQYISYPIAYFLKNGDIK